jgi:hypothetical protein
MVTFSRKNLEEEMDEERKQLLSNALEDAGGIVNQKTLLEGQRSQSKYE